MTIIITLVEIFAVWFRVTIAFAVFILIISIINAAQTESLRKTLKRR